MKIRSVIIWALYLLSFTNLSICLMAQSNESTPWVTYPSANTTQYGVYHFRKAIQLNEIPEKFIIHISADNRYNLFVNGQRVCYGPAKGDLQTYKYDIIDIAPYLLSGNNQIAALVYNGGKDKPLAFFSVQTAFFLRSENPKLNFVNTDDSWKVFKNPAYQVISYYEMLFKERWFYGFYACGGGDEIFGDKYPWGWELVEFDDTSWNQAELLNFETEPWNLVPRNIAFMDNHREKPAAIRIKENVTVHDGFLTGTGKVTVSANTKARILFDYDMLTMGYPELTVDYGAGSSIKIKYAEALYEEVNLKAHRDSVDGKIMFGVWDIFHPDGKATRKFRPLWKRTFRYVMLEIETMNNPLDIISFESEYSGYPYPEMSTFKSNNKKLNQIFENSLRTLRMCSGETYYDTPFYEQLSYGGDNRPIASISMYNSVDDRLFREVMRLYPQSVNRETGLFKSAYPSRFNFDMGSWSLAWIQSLHDYYFMRGDSAYIEQFVNPIEGVLGFYERHIDESKNILGTVKNQNFMDWSISKGSIPRSNENREMVNSIMLTLNFVHTMDCTVRLFEQIGLKDNAHKWGELSERIKEGVRTTAWNEEKQLFSDYPGGDIFSQHTNLLAILCDLVPAEDQKTLLQRILDSDEFDEMASSYFSFFLFKAMQKTGQEDLFLEHLDFWYNFLETGHTTTGETGFASHDRSDCHAWSAHPAYYLLSIVCGIQPADIGFEHVRITPHLGELTQIEASMPHPKGKIKVNYKINRGKLNANIELPKGLTGDWEYNSKRVALKEGLNIIN